MRHLLFSALALVLLTSPAWAHGSSYREFRGPPGQYGPPGPGVPRFPGPAGQGVARIAKDSWEWWWSLNKEPFLYPAPSAFSRRRPEGTSRVRREIVTPLARAVDAPLGCPGRSRAALALGAVGASQGGLPRPVLKRLATLTGDRKQQVIVQASTALALGMSQTRHGFVVDALCDTVLDKDAPSPVRGSAALALGLLRPALSANKYRKAAETLRRAVESGPSGSLLPCALLAMGVSRDGRFQPVVQGLIERELAAASRRLDDRELSYALSALGKLAEDVPGVATRGRLRLVTEAFRSSGEFTRRSAIVALGQLGTDPEISEEIAGELLDELTRVAGTSSKPLASLAVLALGRIGGAAPSPAIRARCLGRLLDLANADGAGLRPHAALAFALLGREPGLTAPDRQRILDFLRGGLPKAGDAPDAPRVLCSDGVAPADPPTPPSDPPTDPTDPAPPPPSPAPDPAAPGAYALALGLLGDRASVPALLAVVADDTAHARVRGYAAVALGMLGAREVATVVRDGFDPTRPDDFVVLGALGAGLARKESQGPSELYPCLLRALAGLKGRTFSANVVTRALGKLGDPRAQAPLLAILNDEKTAGGSRSVAAVALADLYDRRGAFVLTRIFRDLDFAARVGTLELIFSVL